MDEPRSIAVVRAALRRLGLSDEETERFLAILGRDLVRGSADEKAAILEACEAFVETVPDVEERFGGVTLLSQRLAKILEILTLGVLSALIYDLIKGGFSDAPQQEPPSEGRSPHLGAPQCDVDVSSGDLTQGPPYVVRGLKTARRCLDLTVGRAAAVCSLSKNNYLAAERGLPVSGAVAQRIKFGVLRECSLKGVILWCLQRNAKEGIPPVGRNELIFAGPNWAADSYR